MGVSPETFTPMPVHIVGVSGGISVHYDPHQKKWFCDQGAIVFTGTPDF